ncbi:hypothetical protein MRX96_040189 [Rhipicephalus microplus]
MCEGCFGTFTTYICERDQTVTRKESVLTSEKTDATQTLKHLFFSALVATKKGTTPLSRSTCRNILRPMKSKCEQANIWRTPKSSVDDHPPSTQSHKDNRTTEQPDMELKDGTPLVSMDTSGDEQRKESDRGDASGSKNMSIMCKDMG